MAQLRTLIAFQVDFALDNPALITVHDRDLGSLADEDAAQVRRLQRRYVEVWVDVLGRVHPEYHPAANRARAHAVLRVVHLTPATPRPLPRLPAGPLLAAAGQAATPPGRPF